MRLRVRDARPGEIAALEGWSGPLVLGYAKVAEADEVLGWIAWAHSTLGPFCFSGVRPGMTRFPMTIVREAKAMLATLPEAWCFPKDERAARFLRLLGMTPAGQLEGMEVYSWQNSPSTPN